MKYRSNLQIIAISRLCLFTINWPIYLHWNNVHVAILEEDDFDNEEGDFDNENLNRIARSGYNI